MHMVCKTPLKILMQWVFLNHMSEFTHGLFSVICFLAQIGDFLPSTILNTLFVNFWKTNSEQVLEQLTIISSREQLCAQATRAMFKMFNKFKS